MAWSQCIFTGSSQKLWLRLHNTGYNVILYFLCCYNLILNYLQHVATISSLILDVATTSSSITLFCYKLHIPLSLLWYNLILYYFMLLQPHPPLFYVAATSYSISCVAVYNLLFYSLCCKNLILEIADEVEFLKKIVKHMQKK